MGEHHHIYRPFDDELRLLKDKILAMGGLVETHIAQAMEALMARDESRAKMAIEGDRKVNKLELEVDELCVRLIALRQPAGSDLRFVAASLKIVTDLERIGDLAVNLARQAIRLCHEPVMNAVVDLPRMAEAARKMLRDVLDAFVRHDIARAGAVVTADDQVDEWLAEVFHKLTVEMERDSTRIRCGLTTLLFAKYIERLADHIVNIAQMVVFVVRGEDIRHARMK